MFNQVTALGRLGSDPELRYTASGTAVANFSLATDVGWGENKSTVWFRVNAWDKQAEFVNNYLAKGKTVLVVGELSLNEYSTNSGEKRTSLELRAREIKFGGDPPDKTNAIVDAVSDITIAVPIETDQVEELPW
jgi:single-strand DNA-binding protein